MKLFRRKPFEEKVKEALDTYREDALTHLFPAGLPDAMKIVSDLAELCGLQRERCTVGQCEELLDLYAEVANGTETGANREMKVTLLRKKYGEIVNGFATADQICNYCEQQQGTGSQIREEEEILNVEPDELDEERMDQIPEPEIQVTDLKTLAGNLTEAFDLGGKERKKAMEILKPERKRAIREAMNKAPNEAKTAVRMVFEAGCIASGGKLQQTEAERLLPGAILMGSGAEENWQELEEEEKKMILKLAWQMGVRAGVRENGSADPEDEK